MLCLMGTSKQLKKQYSPSRTTRNCVTCLDKTAEEHMKIVIAGELWNNGYWIHIGN